MTSLCQNGGEDQHRYQVLIIGFCLPPSGILRHEPHTQQKDAKAFERMSGGLMAGGERVAVATSKSRLGHDCTRELLLAAGSDKGRDAIALKSVNVASDVEVSYAARRGRPGDAHPLGRRTRTPAVFCNTM